MQGEHLLPRPEVRTVGREEGIDLFQGASSPRGGEDVGDVPVARARIVHIACGEVGDAGPVGRFDEGAAALAVKRGAGVRQFDRHVSLAEKRFEATHPFDGGADVPQSGRRPGKSRDPGIEAAAGALRPLPFQPLQSASDASLSAAAEDHPISAGGSRQVFELVASAVLFPARQHRLPHRPGKASVSFGVPSQEDDVLAGRISLGASIFGQKGQFGSDDGGQPGRPGCGCKLNDAGEAAVVGHGEGLKVQFAGPGDEVGGKAGPVEKAVGGVDVQLRVRNRTLGLGERPLRRRMPRGPRPNDGEASIHTGPPRATFRPRNRRGRPLRRGRSGDRRVWNGQRGPTTARQWAKARRNRGSSPILSQIAPGRVRDRRSRLRMSAPLPP